ncbi:uncharacterized protein LOC134339340 [Mobula hypostoma]|uniref:uncharacterized protein LOC134339340 n=1 Tax=Mobula hypostoma TaxID=723540 RepID=UPI002FC2E95F
MWQMFRGHLCGVLCRYVPMIQGKDGRVQEPWCIKAVVNLVEKKRRAYERLKKLGNDRDLEDYKASRKELKNEIRRARRDHEKALASRIKENPKAFYKYVKSKRIRRERTIKCDSGKVYMEPEETAKVLNEYLASVFTTEEDLSDCWDDVQQTEKLGHIDIKKEDMLELLENIKLDKSLKLDKMYPRLLWEVREEIADPLAIIFASSIGTGEAPEDWRVADVVPLFKKGSRDSPGNYRPVSLTSAVGKLMEKILRGRIYGHLERHNVITKSHFDHKLLPQYTVKTKQRSSRTMVLHETTQNYTRLSETT